MTLRVRLVAALAALLTVGLVVFGVATYRIYANSQYDRLDQQIRNSVALVTRDLAGPVGRDGPGGGPQQLVAPGTYAELRGPDGTQVGNAIQVPGATDLPELPTTLTAGNQGRFFDVGSEDGSTPWRVLVEPLAQGYSVVVAVPTTDVAASLDRLVLIEVVAGGALLLALAVGSWFILRRGLRPLEQMASTARTITAGDLSRRVDPGDGRTEVGQLGVALNTMLGEIEEAFRERQATEDRLRQFLADASHELRTPLTSIQGFAELYRIGDRDHVDLAVILRRIEEESARMKELVEDLLLLARLDQTRPAERAPVDLAVLAADACSDAVAADPGRPVTLDAPEPVVVLGDRDHLRQVMANLVTNAVAHTPAGTPIEVSTRLEGGHATLTVRDHGPGLDGDALAHAFDRFWRADSARVGSGAGLGLAIVAGIADEHGGVAAARNAPSGGAEFVVTLPIGGAPDGDGHPQGAPLR